MLKSPRERVNRDRSSEPDLQVRQALAGRRLRTSSASRIYVRRNGPMHRNGTAGRRFRVSDNIRIKGAQTRPGAVSGGNWATPSTFSRATTTPRRRVTADDPGCL